MTGINCLSELGVSMHGPDRCPLTLGEQLAGHGWELAGQHTLLILLAELTSRSIYKREGCRSARISEKQQVTASAIRGKRLILLPERSCQKSYCIMFWRLALTSRNFLRSCAKRRFVPQRQIRQRGGVAVLWARVRIRTTIG